MSAIELDGFHAVKHVLRFAPDLVTSVAVTSRSDAERLCGELAPDVTDALLARAVAAHVAHPTGVAGVARRPAVDRTCLATRLAPMVVLDGPRHPGNAGAVIRVAAAAGASGVGVLAGSTPLDPWHPAVVRGAAGLHYALPVLTLPSLDQVSGPVVALDADGEPWEPLPDNAVLVVGGERSGVSDRVRNGADRVVALPMRSGVSSLNLATAVSAALYAWRLGVAGRAPG